MKRRAFVTLLGGAAAAWPLATRAQQAAKLPTIGFLGAEASNWSLWTAAFAARLRELGWSEGRTIAIEYRWSEGRAQSAADIAAEFVRLKAAVIVTNYSGAVTRYLAQKAPRGVSTVAAPLLAGPLLLADVCARQEREVQSPYELRWSTRFDEQFEGFWTELQQRRPDLFLSSRARSTLEWHFKYAVQQNRIWVLTAWEGPRLFAYGIFECRDGRAVDLTRIFIVDFQTLVRDPGLGSAMISHALSRCRRERIHVLENAGCWLEALQPIAKRPPYHRSLESWGYLYQCRNPQLASALQSPKSWYPTQLDGDSSL